MPLVPGMSVTGHRRSAPLGQLILHLLNIGTLGGLDLVGQFGHPADRCPAWRAGCRSSRRPGWVGIMCWANITSASLWALGHCRRAGARPSRSTPRSVPPGARTRWSCYSRSRSPAPPGLRRRSGSIASTSSLVLLPTFHTLGGYGTHDVWAQPRSPLRI